MTRSRTRRAADPGIRAALILCATFAVSLAGLAGCSDAGIAAPVAVDVAKLEAEVAATETAFAATMARRDFGAFAEFIAPDAVFFSGPEPLRGRDAVTTFWQRFYSGPAAPFAWKPETVRVLASGELAISTGPVTAASGEIVSTFTSIWRRESGGQWKIVFDKGNDVCRCAAPP